METAHAPDISVEFDTLPEYSVDDKDATLHEEEQKPFLTPIQETGTEYHDSSEIKMGHYTCALFLSEPAAWYWPRAKQHLSDAAAHLLSSQHFLDFSELQPIQQNPGPTDPLSGLALATIHTVTEVLGGTMETLNIDSQRSSPGRESARGLARLTLAGLKAPRDFTLALAEGFNNMPRLYGDHGEAGGVRPAPVITGVGSGMVAAGKVRILAGRR